MHNKEIVGGLEVCANSYTSALAAQKGGAIRVEFCDNLAEGGTTPSYGQIALAKKNLTIAIWPIIRPRGGDFLYSDIEFELMKEDIIACKSLKCEGVVIGILHADGSIDKARCAELIALAQPMGVAFHRAFDMSNNMVQALEDLVELKVQRVLTSGGAPNAPLGIEKLAQLVKQANGRIAIMPGAGINEGNIQELITKTGAKEFHASAKGFVASKMEYRNTEAKMGSIEDEYRYELTSEEKVKGLTEIIRKNLNK
ncbi:copper homeostasis protein CutC [Pedobacter sp. HDW13]|uniref:copper homeostasis protein CutC n=1 Tax=unclassified Pedobacter TaxID=2628915 RepID=UPI000F591C16|nr:MULTISPECIES: copper homeostasis protein CutC [unclassified Pedobacter]QIL41841.1 copper homeostasis protein CutC [Pedobacter sp. HDW13]RQO73379.1 copper homeostasis protein CutC [Pedobacter sp. KBW01]